MEAIARKAGVKQYEQIGIWWLGHELRTPKGRKIKGKLWLGVCKKTRRTAFACIASDTIHAMAPMIIQNTDIQDGKCFDGASCLNVDCPYATSEKLIDAINKTNFKGLNSDENLENFFKNEFEAIEGYFKGMKDSEIQEHFVEGYTGTSVSDPAFETREKR